MEKRPQADRAGAGPHPRRWRSILVCCVLILAGLKTFRTVAGALDVSRCSHIQWTPCPPEYPAILDCGRLDVPMAYHRPWLGRITLGMVRLNASGPRPLGNIVVNPGGPGSSAVKVFVRKEQRELVSENLIRHYNIIAPDPRGVGISHAVKCDVDLVNKRVPGYVESLDDYEKLAMRNEALGRSCRKKTGPVFDHLDTTSAAKDLDRIRKALGDQKLNFMGVSYGTQLGSQYAELFPQHVGRMVLDGVLDHSQNQVDGFMTEAVTAESSFRRFAKWCNTTSDCVYHGQDFSSIFDSMVDEANKRPIPAPGCLSPEDKDAPDDRLCRSNVTGYEIISNMQDYLSRPIKWVQLSKTLQKASEGDATQLSPPLSALEGKKSHKSQKMVAHTAISCQDWQAGTGRRAASHTLARLLAARALAPHTRGVSEMLEIQLGCIGWPAPVANPPRQLSREQLSRAPPILLVNAFHDPSTSIVWAVGLREQMPTAVSVFRDGDGHTSYWDYGETQKVIDRFLIEGIMPKDLAVFNS